VRPAQKAKVETGVEGVFWGEEGGLRAGEFRKVPRTCWFYLFNDFSHNRRKSCVDRIFPEALVLHFKHPKPQNSSIEA